MISEPTPTTVDRDVRAGLELAVRFLHEEINALRAAGVAVGEDDYRGLYISDSEADRLLGGARLPSSRPPRSASANALREELATLTAGASGRLCRLAALGPLGPFEVGVLLLCLASEVDASVERLLAYAQDDVTRRRPRVDLLLRLFGDAGYEERDAFLPHAPLIRLRLIALVDEPGQPATPLGARYVSLDPRVAEYLLGSDALCHPLAGSASIQPSDEDPALLLDHHLRLALRGVAAAPDHSRPRTVALCGPDRALLRAAASAIASGWDRPLLVANAPRLVAEAGIAGAVTLALREAVMQDAVPLLEQLDQLDPADRARLATELEGQLFVPITAVGMAVEGGWPGFRIDIDELDFDRRSLLWRQAIPGAEGVADGSVDSVAAKFRLGVDAIQRAGQQAAIAAQWRDPAAPTPSATDLHASARSQSAPILSSLARKITPHYHWDDLVLPGDALEQLREISSRVEHRHRVYEAWGFERKLSLSRGVIALLAGNSGTGKTMAAEVMANALGLDLYRIDLSAVVSKYIGETEKNLDAIFREAERSNAVLFFDEADALFGKRSE
ncbi:MAG: ATP-binding protein, partial [Dehalococcoidia bacterium]